MVVKHRDFYATKQSPIPNKTKGRIPPQRQQPFGTALLCQLAQRFGSLVRFM